MSPGDSSASPAKQIKEWVDLLAPFLTTAGVLANLVYEAIPLAPGLRPLATFIAIPFCIIAFLCSRAWAARRRKGWPRYCIHAWLWLGVFLLMITAYRLLLGYFRYYPSATWQGNIAADVLQVSVYAVIFGVLSVALTLAFACATQPVEPAAAEAVRAQAEPERHQAL